MAWLFITAGVVLASSPTRAFSKEPPGPDSLTTEPYTLRTFDGGEHAAELLSFRVPENRRRFSGRFIRLRCVRLAGPAAHRRPPIVFLSGGPGIPATGLARVPVYYALFEKLREVSDVLLLDQRGMGMSALSVPPVNVDVPADVFASPERLLEFMERGLGESIKAHRSAGVEVAAYTTTENADDVDDLRRILRAERVNLLGFSYGTSLAMVFAHRHPGSVHRMVLAGVHGPDQLLERPSAWDAQITKLTIFARKDSTLDPRLANLDSVFHVALTGLQREELRVEIPDPVSGKSVAIRWGAPGFLYLLRERLNDRSIPLVPALLWAFAERDTAVLRPSIAQTYGSLRSGLSATNLALSVSRGWSDRRRAEATRDSAKANMNLVNLQWNPRVREMLGLDARPEFIASIRTPVPTLFLSGTLDSNTPLEDAAEVVKGFANGVFVKVENGSHETLPAEDVQNLVVDFFKEQPFATPKVTLPPPQFLPLDEATVRLKSPTRR